jgi:hypothetical protein
VCVCVCVFLVFEDERRLYIFEKKNQMKEPLVLVISKLLEEFNSFSSRKTQSYFYFSNYFCENRAYVYQNRFFDLFLIHIYEP